MKNKLVLSIVIGLSIVSMVFNGLITYLILKNLNFIQLNLDCISLRSNSLPGISIYMALVLTILFSFVSFLFLKQTAKMKGIAELKPILTVDYWPDVFVMSLRNAIFSFGLILILASLILSRPGYFEVSTIMASFIGGFIALAITGITLYSTFDTILAGKK